MRVNVYSEEMTDRIEIVEKVTPDGKFTGLRFYLELPVTVPANTQLSGKDIAVLEPIKDFPAQDVVQVRGRFMHKPGDDDSAAVTFWGKSDLREALKIALKKLDEYYAAQPF